MQIEVNGTRLWFDVDGAGVVPDGPGMRERPTVVLVHGGPGGYDHSYFKPDLAPLTRVAQVVYLDLRDHGRSARHDPADWTFEVCADDVRAFCDSLGIARPIVYGHSMGGFVAMLYGARHPGHAAALVLQSTMARFDLERLVRVSAASPATRSRSSRGATSAANRSRTTSRLSSSPRSVRACPMRSSWVGGAANADMGVHGMDLVRTFDVVDQLGRIDCPTLVCVGEVDAVTPIGAAREIYDALPEGIGRLEVIEGAGHFPWRDSPIPTCTCSRTS